MSLDQKPVKHLCIIKKQTVFLPKENVIREFFTFRDIYVQRPYGKCAMLLPTSETMNVICMMDRL